MFAKTDECPACGHINTKNYLICVDHSVTGESFALVKCDNCSHVFTNPRPSDDRLGTYYQSTDYISHTNKITSPIHLIYKLVRQITLRQKESLITKLNKKRGSLLDYGCGTGHFIQHCTAKGWLAKGVEPDEHARQIAASHGLNVIPSLEKNIEKFSIITAWHVLEHVTEPFSTLKELRNRLEEGGHIVIAVPNHASFDAKHYGKYWAGYDVPRHLSHFTQKSMRALAERSKLKVKSIEPMPFDAYYVSLLSEKYAHEKSRLLQALTVGRKSNATAKLTGEYSSLIYILTR